MKSFLESILNKYKAIDKVDSLKRIHSNNDGVPGQRSNFQKEKMPTQPVIPNAQLRLSYSKNLGQDQLHLAKKIDKRIEDLSSGKAKGEIHNVPLHTVVTDQRSVSSRVVGKKIEGTWNLNK